MMIKKANLPKVESRKRRFGKDSKGKTRQPVEKKREVIQAYLIGVWILQQLKVDQDVMSVVFNTMEHVGFATPTTRNVILPTDAKNQPNRGTTTKEG